MVKGDKMEKIIASIEKSIEELFTLESVIKVTKETCLERELTGNYYNLEEQAKASLSEERNHYINLLGIALEIISNIKETNLTAEIESCKLKQNTNYSSRKVTA